MTSTPDRENLDELRAEIDELKNTPTEELIDPAPSDFSEAVPQPTPSDAIGSEKWDEPADEEHTEL